MTGDPEVREITPDQIAQAYYDVFTSAAGDIVLADLVRRFGFTTKSLFDRDPGTMALNEGQRLVVMHIGAMLETPEMNLAEGDVTHATDI